MGELAQKADYRWENTMTTNVLAKDSAAEYLVKRGWTIIDNDSNADIVAKDGDQTVLVDVDFDPCDGGTPRLWVDHDRGRELMKKALYYLMGHPCEPVRVDVIAISFHGEKPAKIRHLVGAFDSDRC